ncbi:MAG: trigger factor [Lachnospiraceae bacterium]|nr:trigger factor [Lachnospiraceae bacterium]
MSTQVEKLEHSMVKLTVEVPAEDFEKAVRAAYNKRKKSITVPGFRKGHAPQQLIEKLYGPAVFYEDAANDLINATYDEEAKGTGLVFTSRPEIDVEQIEKGKAFIYTALVATRPEVVLGQYRGIEVAKQDLTVSDAEIDEEIKREQEKNGRLVEVDRPAENGDTVVLDYAGTVDGVAFDGGTAEGYSLVLGSNSFIPGFEEQLIGVSAGESKDVHVTFPEQYHAEELAGKDAVFACTVHKVQYRELPELDDEFAQDVSEFETFEEYRNSVAETIRKRKENSAKTAQEDEAVSKLIESSVMDIPEAMINSQVDQMFMDYARRLESQGMDIYMYMQYMGMDEAKMREDLRPQAERRIKTRLVLEEVVKAEQLETSDLKLEEELDRIAKQYGMELEELKKNVGDYERDQMKQDLAVQEAISLILDTAKEV